MVDDALVLRKLHDLRTYSTQIREYQNVSLQEYRNDWKAQRIVERTLQLMIEVCLDIANHLISDRDYRSPDSYADCFRVLHENHILSLDLSERMVAMARFRNLIVHDYSRIDAEIMIGILKKHLRDFDAYAASVAALADVKAIS